MSLGAAQESYLSLLQSVPPERWLPLTGKVYRRYVTAPQALVDQTGSIDDSKRIKSLMVIAKKDPGNLSKIMKRQSQKKKKAERVRKSRIGQPQAKNTVIESTFGNVRQQMRAASGTATAMNNTKVKIMAKKTVKRAAALAGRQQRNAEIEAGVTPTTSARTHRLEKPLTSQVVKKAMRDREFNKRMDKRRHNRKVERADR